MLARLFAWFEEWLSIDTYLKEPYEKDLLLVKAYNRKGLYKLANRTAKQLENNLKAKMQLSLDSQSKLVQLYNLKYYSNNPLSKEENDSLFKDLIVSHLLATKELTLGYMLEVENKRLNKNYEDEWIETLNDLLIQIPYQTPLSELMKLSLTLMKEDDIKKLDELYNILESSQLDQSSDLYLLLTLYIGRIGHRLWQRNKLKDFSTLIKVYQLRFKALDQHPDRKLRPVHLFNGVNFIALNANIEQTADFINFWIAKVQTKSFDSTYKYCQAINMFRHEAYEQLPQLLSGLELDDVNYKIISIAKLIIAYYKLNEEDLTLTLIQNFKRQLKRNKKKVTKFVYAGLNNLIALIELLQKSKYQQNKRINLDDFQPIFFKSWVDKELKISKG